MISTAPILLFSYKRLGTLKLTVAALQANYLAGESELFIFSDGHKDDKDEPVINEVRSFLREIRGFKKIHISESKKNKGLANSIIDGVTEVFNQYESVIVLEDDLITTPNFLCFMNASLEKFKLAKKVFSISGYSFNLDSREPNKTYFLNRGWSWGWATWKDRWEEVDWQIKDYESFKIDPLKKKEFSKGGSDLNKMLRNQIRGNLDSWAIRWFYNQFKVQGLTLYPTLSKVYNDGFDSYATHTNGSNKRYQPIIDPTKSHTFYFPELIKIDAECQKKFQKRMGIVSRIKSKLDTILLRFSK